MALKRLLWNRTTNALVSEQDEGGTTTVTYTQEPVQYGSVISQRRGGQTSYYHYDGLGDTRELTDASETVTDTNLYDAWGVNVASTGTTENPFKWRGRVGYYHEGGDDYYVRARSYQPTIGRWMSADPLLFVDGANLYLANFVPGAIDQTGLTTKIGPPGTQISPGVNPRTPPYNRLPWWERICKRLPAAGGAAAGDGPAPFGDALAILILINALIDPPPPLPKRGPTRIPRCLRPTEPPPEGYDPMRCLRNPNPDPQPRPNPENTDPPPPPKDGNDDGDRAVCCIWKQSVESLPSNVETRAIRMTIPCPNNFLPYTCCRAAASIPPLQGVKLRGVDAFEGPCMYPRGDDPILFE